MCKSPTPIVVTGRTLAGDVVRLEMAEIEITDPGRWRRRRLWQQAEILRVQSANHPEVAVAA